MLAKTIMMNIRITIILIFFSGIFHCQQTGKVIGISDGDTITILLQGNIQKKLRLAEVDCPERGQPFGKNAKEFTSQQVFKKEITYIEIDTDRYGRTIAKVFYDGNKYLSAELIKAGLGWWYSRYSNDKSLGKLQEHAQQNKIGLWQDSRAIAPWEWRKTNRRKLKRGYIFPATPFTKSLFMS